MYKVIIKNLKNNTKFVLRTQDTDYETCAELYP